MSKELPKRNLSPEQLEAQEAEREIEREITELQRLPQERQGAMMLLSLLRIADAVERIADSLDERAGEDDIRI